MSAMNPGGSLTCDSLSASEASGDDSRVTKDCAGTLCAMVGVAVPLEVPSSVEGGIERLPWLLCSETVTGMFPGRPTT